MNPITWALAHTVARTLARVCPNCRHVQFTRREQVHETVRCSRCQAEIPPAAERRR